MSLEIWVTYIVATILILVLPGPTIILVVSQAISHGRKSVIPLVAGVVFGDFTAMTLSLLGLGAIINTSAALFTCFKIVGAIYLFYLGLCLWRKQPQTPVSKDSKRDISTTSLFKSSYIVTALNPKTIAFFVAFLPQFVDQQAPAFWQLFSLGATFLFLALINAALYAVFASQLREAMENPRVRRCFNRFGGGALIGAGILTASMHHS